MVDDRMKDMKILTKDAKLIEKIGRKHRTDPSSNRTNKCLNCAGDHGTCDCPTRQQPHTFPIGNPANNTGIYKDNSQFQNHSLQQHSQQSASTVGTLMVNNQLQIGPQQDQQQHPSPQIPPISQHENSPIRHNQFNQHFQQPPIPQVSPLMAPPQQYNPQIPPRYFHQYPPTNSPSVESNELLLTRVFHRQMNMAERQEKCDWEGDKKSVTRREKKEKRHKEECEK